MVTPEVLEKSRQFLQRLEEIGGFGSRSKVGSVGTVAREKARLHCKVKGWAEYKRNDVVKQECWHITTLGQYVLKNWEVRQ